MKRPLQIIRVFHINFVMARYGLDRFILAAPGFYPFRFLSYLNPWYWVNKRRGKTRGECLRLALEELGPIFVKFGQILSTRRDLLPDDIAEELEKLQDRVPPFPGEKAKAIIEKAFKKPLSEIFAEFNLVPLASASIAQVHAATFQDGREVVVKVLRPNIEKVISHDIGLLYTVASLVEHLWSHGPRLRPREIVAEFERTIFDELDLMREAGNASQLRRNFLNSELLYVPEVYWDYARSNVVVFERIHGIPISNIDKLKQAGVDIKKLAERGVEIFFTQVFRDSFFHADMHPGNIFVAKRDPKNPIYIGVDFGIMGSLSPTDQRYLAENFVAFFHRDYRRVAVLHVESGWVPPDTRIEEFEATIRAVCEPVFERPLKDISFGQLLLRLFQTARRFHMQVQPQLMLLQKTLLNIEGLGRQLYPDLDLWATAKPLLERWIKQQTGPRAFLRKAKENSPLWWEKMADIPDLIYDVLTKTKVNLFEREKSLQIVTTKENKDLKRKHQKGFLLGIGIAFIIATALNLLFNIEVNKVLLNTILLVLGIFFIIIFLF
jgi:ubiquinone biosynthesis protein